MTRTSVRTPRKTGVKVGIIGLGFVGLSLAAVLSSKNIPVVGIETDFVKFSKIIRGNPPFYEPGLKKMLKNSLKKHLVVSTDISLLEKCDFIFVSVGTPQKNDGGIDLSHIKKSVSDIGKLLSKSKKQPIIIIKSTVTPKTTQNVIIPILEQKSKKTCGKEFGLITNPEFLRESKAIDDTQNPHVIVLGGSKTKFMNKLKNFYSSFNKSVPIFVTNYQTAELIKYANNSFLATKISFINQLANICQNIPETNIDDISRIIGLDPRIGNLFLNAGPGYGGSCLPKDVKALINFSSKVGTAPTLLNAVEKINERQLSNVISLMKKTLGNIKSKNISILGTAFKPDTDDVRDSVAIELIKKLLKMKANVRIHDPKAIENTKRVLGDRIEYSNTMNDALKNSHCVVIMTRWKMYEELNNNSIKNMRKKLIIDCRRVLVNKKLVADYHAIGIGKN